jgi:RNA-directed DNA polymerase
MSIETADQMLGSWSGHARYGSTRNFVQSILDRRPYIQLDQRGNLAINKEELTCYIKKMTNTN